MRFITAILLAITAYVGVLLVLGAIFDYLMFCPGWERGFLSGLEWWYPIAVFVSVVVNWFLAGYQKDMFMINGSGTKLFGQTPSQNGYIATKWISLFWFPILPVESYEVLAKQQSGMQANYTFTPLEDLHWPQIIVTAIKGYGILFSIIVAFAVFFNFICFSVFPH